MSGVFTKEQIEDLLDNVLETPKRTQWKGDKIQFCCPIHGERNPSCGINLDYCPDDEPDLHGQVFNCFSCGEYGSITRLVYKSLPDKFKSLLQADKFLNDRYGFTSRYLGENKRKLNIKRYGEIENKKDTREVKPMSMIAPFRSGKETYQYFFDRGFDKEDMRTYKIGRDVINETVTIPIFWEDEKLAGVIGRYIDPSRPKNSRFMVYEFNRSKLIYPLDKVQPVEDTLILMESCFDTIMLNKWGYPNAIASMTNRLSKYQAEQIKRLCSKLIILQDLDERGIKLVDTAKQLLKGDVQILLPTYKPRRGKDPCEWGELETVKVINSATGRREIPRY